MTARHGERYLRRKISIRRFAIAFGLFELLMFVLGYGLGVMALMGVFWISLLIGPLMIFPWIVQANTRSSDEEFESPVLWHVLAFLGFAASVVLVVAGSYAISQGSATVGFSFYGAGLLVFLFSLRTSRSASHRFPEWRRMKAAQKMWCPACGTHGPHKLDICRNCGAIVFWVPSWLS